MKAKFSVFVVAGLIGMTGLAQTCWSAETSFEANKISLVSRTRVLVSPNEMGPASRTSVLNRNLCNTANAGGPDMVLNRNDPYYKELLSLALVGHLMPRPFTMILDDATCTVINIQFFSDRTPN